MQFKAVKFSKGDNAEFFQTVRTRVQGYFEDKQISTHGDHRMVIKTVFMFSLYLIPYFMMLSGVAASISTVFICWTIMGFGLGGIGLAVMHDANHGAYSGKKWVNKMLGYSMNFVGGSAVNWRIQHNLLHHSYTNIDGKDEDINPGKILRFSPNQPRLKHHRLQFIYAWFLYGLMTLAWVLTRDYRQLLKYKRMGLSRKENPNFRVLMTELLAWKVFYLAYILVIPLLFVHIPWYLMLLFFVWMHFIAGIMLACIFQPAHVVPESDFLEARGNKVEDDWAVHQLKTTTNFSNSGGPFSWFIGGLNFQIEHHLFPKICHVHYPQLSKIVKQTAKEYGLPYHVQPTFAQALWSHAKMLWFLGRYDSIKA